MGAGSKEEMAWQEEKWVLEDRLRDWGAVPIRQGSNQRHSHTLTV